MTIKERFLSHVRVGGPDECWPWQEKSRDEDGYGKVKFKGRVERSHRVSFLLFNGNIDPGNEILHKCDNPPCCNPGHLSQGTHKENMVDKKKKDRTRGTDILTRDQVKEIREARMKGVPLARLARKYKVGISTISMAATGKNHKIKLFAIGVKK